MLRVSYQKQISKPFRLIGLVFLKGGRDGICFGGEGGE